MLREPEFGNRKRADKPVRILLLEDDAHFADLLRTQLRRMPWAESRLEVAGTLAEALRKLAAESFGLVLADLNLPDASGLKAVEALARSGEQLIIVLTGNRDPGMRAAAIEAGAYDFLSKDDLSAAALERLVRLASIQANTFRSLRASEARFRGLVELSSDWYWEQDEELRFTRLEGSVSERSGHHPRQAIGKRPWEIAGITPVSSTWDEHRALLEARQSFRDFEYSRIGDDGELCYVSVSGEPVYDAHGRFTGYRGLASDSTLRKRDDERVRRFRLAMDTSADMILLIDRASMRHVDVNATACRLLGYSRQELLAMGPSDILPLKSEELGRVYDRMIAAPHAVSGMRSHYRCKDGSLLPFESTRQVMRSGDNWIIAVISRDLRDRLASEKALEESEARKAAILDAAMDAIVTMDHAGRIIEFNAAAERDFGYSRDQAIGKDMAELLIPPELRAAHRKGLARYVATREGQILGKRIEVQAMRADGSRFDAELAIVRIPGSEPPLFTGTARDITARKYEERLLALEHTVNHCLAVAETAQEGIETVVRAICLAQSWKAGRFYRLDEAANAMRFELGISVGGGQAGELLARARLQEFARGVGLPGLVWQTGDALWISDTATDPRVARPDLAREIGQHSALLFPVRAEGSIIGVISIASDSIREPDERLRKTMELVGSQIGQFLQRKRAEEELQRFRLAMDNSADMIVLVDRATMRFVDVNRTVCALLGYAREEMLAMGPQDVLPVTHAELEVAYDKLIADPSTPSGMKSHYRCKDGSLLPFESTRHVLRSGEGWLVAAISRDMRERLAAEKSLRDSEARFRSLTALSSDWYWEQDEQFRLTYMSAIEQTGLDASAYLGLKRWDQPALNLSAEDWARHRAQLERHEPFHDFEMERPSADGGSVWLALSGEPVFDQAGRFTGYRGVGRDITQRKRSEREVTRLGRMYAALGAANEAILRATSPQEVFDRACEIAVDAGEFLLGTVLLLDPQNRALTRVAASGPAAAAVAREVPPIDGSQPDGGGVIGHACRSGQAAISNDYGNDANTAGRRSLLRREVNSAAAFPLFVEGELAGVFGLQHAERNAFSEALTGLLHRLADNISFALDNFHREARRLQAEKNLREEEERFRGLTGLSSDMYWTQDTEYRFTDFSGTGPLRAGRPRILGKHRWDTRYFNMSEADWAAHRAVLDARQPFHDLEMGRISESGEKVWVSVSGEPVFDEAGAFTGYRGVGKDITARKREEALRVLEHGVSRCLAEADSAASGLQAVMRLICESQSWECGRYFALDEHGAVLRFGESWGVSTPAVEEFLARSRSKVYRAGEGLSGTVWSSGEPLWVSDVSKDSRATGSSKTANGALQGGSFVFPVRAEGRTVGVLSFSSGDVRKPDERLLQAVQVIGSQVGQFLERKHTEIAVRESEARFRSLTNLSSDWFWEQDADFRFSKFEGKGHGDGSYAPAAAVLGKQLWELGGIELESFDLDGHRARLARHESFRQLEYSYRDRSGERFYVSADGEPLFDEQGRFAGYRGTSRDVTAQRRGEEELRRFRAAMDMSLDAIYLTERASMRFVDVNEAACRGVGFSREQLLGMGPQDLLRAPRREIEEAFDAVIAQGQQGVRAENSYVAKDGTTRWTELHRRALRSNDGWIIVTISRDITERKRAEEHQAANLHYQEKLSRFGQAALGRRQPAELVDEAVQTVLEALAAEAVAYLERGPGEREVVQRSLVGLAAGSDASTAALAEGNPILLALASGTRLAAPGSQLQLPWAAGLAGALIPVRGESRARGALCVCTAPAEPFSAEALNFMEAIASVLSTGLQRIESEGRLAYLAQFDPLTGLPNRALLADRFSQIIVQARRHARPLGVLFIDLDEFKLVNDNLGHAGGDELLKEVAVRLQASVRPGDTVARISGDEFAVVLADLARPEDAALVAQKILERLAAPVDVLGHEVFVTASVGIAGFPGDGADAEALIGAADAAMYRAKQSGRNAFQFFTAEINQRSRARAQMGAELRRAVEREEFALVYQPKFHLAGRAAGGAEALLRWK
ncbi:MAG: PAS domain S-box protein, partial [Burkholderiales bacterium]